MTKRIFRSICLVAVAVFLVAVVLIMGVVYNYFFHSQARQLRGQTELVAAAVTEQGKEYLDAVDDTHDCRITWVSTDGNVIFDNRVNSGEMENHLEREEIKEALNAGKGESVRYSDTLSGRQMYCAKRLEDGSVIRLSYTQTTWWRLLLSVIQPVAVVGILAIAFSLFFARRISKSIVKPLNTMDLDNLDEAMVYAELTPFVKRITHQQKQIRNQAEEMERYRREFEAATEGMSEGIMLLNATGAILTVNPSAKRILGISDYCIGKDLVIFNSNERLKKLVRGAACGNHKEATFPIGEHDYQVNASPIVTGGSVRGVAIIILDITEREKAEAVRREFTANVSHELKTPLQTLSGISELLKNGMVNESDKQNFYDRMYSETRRLVSLVEDIIGLSQLDESNVDMKTETIDLLEIAKSTVAELEPVAKNAEVSLEYMGEPVPILGIPQLISGIAYNLCDNAIKYNKRGGEVKISVEKGESSATLTVADTGIGIDEGEKDRIFERFYRVDKSRSKDVGGTGLGLSIVKHAVLLHGGEISVESTGGVGTTIKVTFPYGT